MSSAGEHRGRIAGSFGMPPAILGIRAKRQRSVLGLLYEVDDRLLSTKGGSRSMDCDVNSHSGTDKHFDLA